MRFIGNFILVKWNVVLNFTNANKNRVIICIYLHYLLLLLCIIIYLGGR